MKTKLINTAAMLALAATTYTAAAQTPETFNYQAVITTEDGSPVKKQEITVEVSILQGAKCETNPGTCDLVWQELHKPTTNELGGFSIEIGEPEAIVGGTASDFADIDWLNTAQGQYYMQVRVDFGQASYLNGMTDLGTTRFSAVPYALAAQSAKTADFANGIQPDENDKIGNTIEQLADVDITTPADGQILKYNNGKWENVPFELALNDISDVAITTPNKSDVLTYNYTESKWQNKPLNFTLIDGVDDSGAKTGDVLTYNATDKTWEAQSPTAEKVTKISELTGDVTIKTDLDNGQILKYNGTTKKWENADPAANDLWKLNSTKDGNYISKNTTLGNVLIGTNTATDAPITLLHIAAGGNKNIMLNGSGITLGYSADRTTGTGVIAMGGAADETDHKISGGTACIVGHGSYTANTTTNTIIMGKNSYSGGGNNNIVFGEDNSTGSKNNSAIFGNNLTALINNQTIIGQFNNPTSSAQFVMGFGTSKTDLRNVFTIDKDGNVECTNLTQNSDFRLKTNITTLENSLENVLKLRGVTFNWKKAENGKTQYGFIAQEVEEVLPDLVGTDSNGYKTLNYSRVIPVLTEAIKTQQDEIETLKSENTQLKATLEQLLQRIEALENK